MRRRFTWNALAVVALIAAIPIGLYLLSDEYALAKLFGGRQGLATIRKPDHVDAYRRESGAYPPDDINADRVLAGPIRLSPERQRELVSIVGQHESFEWNSELLCEPMPGVRLSFHRGEDFVDLFLCFECGEMIVYHNGEKTTSRPFEPAVPALTQFVKELFPDDSEIQAIGTTDADGFQL